MPRGGGKIGLRDETPSDPPENSARVPSADPESWRAGIDPSVLQMIAKFDGRDWRTRRASPDEKRAIVEAGLSIEGSGQTADFVASQFGLNAVTYKNWKAALVGSPVPVDKDAGAEDQTPAPPGTGGRKHYTDGDLDRIAKKAVDLYNSGLPMSQAIAKDHLNISRPTLDRALERNGVPKPPVGRRPEGYRLTLGQATGKPSSKSPARKWAKGPSQESKSPAPTSMNESSGVGIPVTMNVSLEAIVASNRSAVLEVLVKDLDSKVQTAIRALLS